MKTHAQAVVIGGGLIGCSILYHLTKLGWKDVVLLERDELTSGSTWHAAANLHGLHDNNNISKLNLGAVTDVTDQFVMINLKGNKIYELFQTGSPFNFNDFQNKKGAVTQTILNKIDVIIHNYGKNVVNLFVRRSFSQHLFSWMNDAASRL